MDKDIIIALGLFFGTSIGGVLIALRQSKMAKSIQGVFVPLEEIRSDVSELKLDARVLTTDLATVKEDIKETKAEVRKAVNDRAGIMTDLAELKGVERGRRDAQDRARDAGTQRDRERP